jgi:hypothetical protein
LATAGWLAFLAFVVLLAVRSVLSERRGAAPGRQPRAGIRVGIRALDAGAACVAVTLVVLLVYIFVSTLAGP